MYKIKSVTTDVPAWGREPKRWGELIEAVKQIPVGKALTVEFDDVKDAIRARNAVRDYINLQQGTITVRTRMVVDKTANKATLYFVKVA